MGKSKRLWPGLVAVSGSLLAFLLVLTKTAYNNAGTINSYLNVETTKITTKDTAADDDPTDYYKSDYGDVNNFTLEDYQKLLSDEFIHSVREQEEGSVLLKNQNNTLPLTQSQPKVTLFGHASVDPFYKANSGGTWKSNSPMLLSYEDALTNAGFILNEKMQNAYKATGGVRGGNPSSFGNQSYDLAEEPVSFYTEALKATFADYNDAAIVMLARTGGEERELPKVDYEGIPHLRLHQNEKDMLKLIKESGAFEKIILLVNSGNPIEIEDLDDYGVTAAMWIGGPGFRGFEGVANLLLGKSVPSGKLVDTFAANSMSAPAMANSGDYDFANADEIHAACSDGRSNTTKSLAYAENIYVGYRYYETRYEDCILGKGNANSSVGSTSGLAWNYAEEVTYPFGFGLSYASFKQSLVDVEVGVKEIVAKVHVKNTSASFSGKSVVEAYVQTPYADYEITNGVEKSAVTLGGFAKTDLLAPGEECDVTISIDKYLFASYDSNNLKGYYLSAGDYYLAIGDDCHDALNNILAKKGASALYDQNGQAASGDKDKAYHWNLASADTISYRESNGYQVTNRFDNADLNKIEEGKINYLSRNHWDTTFPTTSTSITATAEMIKEIDGFTYTKPADAKSANSFIQGNRSDDYSQNIKIADMRALPYDDPKWEEFINQLTVYEMTRIIIDTGGTVGIEAVVKPAQTNQDGPDGAKGGVAVNGNDMPICYPNESVLSATWNGELAAKRGYFLGEDSLFAKVHQLWSPGLNLHRTPYGGRNFEYYSEDPTLCYLMSSLEVEQMQSKGLNVAPKHFALNNQETNRHGVATFANEQTLREIYFRAFEGAFTKGGATGVMTSYNRIGCVYVGHSDALQNQLLRGEWGFKGVIITDMVGSGENYQHTVESLVAGSDMFCLAGNDSRADALLKKINSGEGDGYLLEKLREANHHFYYAFANSSLINGLSSNVLIVTVTPWWQNMLIGLDIGFGVVFIGFAVLSVVMGMRKKEAKA